MRAFKAPTLNELHDKLCQTIVNSPRDKIDVVSGVDVQIHNVIAYADSMEWDFDLKDLWLTKSRWSMMVRQYVPPGDFIAWIEKCTKHIGTRGRGIAMLRTRVILARGGAKKGNQETRRWGSCMLGISYKALPKPQITLYSRTSYLGYLSGMDISVAWMCGKYLANELGIPVEDIAFCWMNEAMQYHNFKSMAYLLNHPDEKMRRKYRRWLRSSEAKLKDLGEWEHVQNCPALVLTRKWLQKLILEDQRGMTLGDMTYNTYRRIRRRYHTEVLGYEKAQTFEGWSYYKKGPMTGQQKEYFAAYKPLESVSIHDLDFSAIKIPFVAGPTYGAAFTVQNEDLDLELDDED